MSESAGYLSAVEIHDPATKQTPLGAGGVSVLVGDSRKLLSTLPSESVNCCVTSPPYWGLRDYGHADQIGQEATPAEYVANLVAVFEEVRRVLRADGTLWLNLGDSYARAPEKGGSGTPNGRNTAEMGYGLAQSAKVGSSDGMTGRGDRPGTRARIAGMKPKDLVGIPWLAAFALREAGWWLRSEIIWHKPNPMPESVTDRPTSAHEKLFLLAKSETYYYDAGAIQEQATNRPSGNKAKSWGTNETPDRASGEGSVETTRGFVYEGSETRNKRNVWTIPTAPYPEAHFATYPPALITPCILAGCPSGGVVLDPFGGSGTTGMVALELGRQAILIELNPDYAKLIDQRTHTTRGFGF